MFGVMAAAYAVVTPVLEIPSGILADRWSRRGVLLLASLALLASVAVGGLSYERCDLHVSAMILGVYFAMQSGTLEAVVYDTVLEESGDSDDYERQYGRMQVANSVALVTGSLAGGVLAEVTQPRTTYLLSLPAYALAAVALVCFREPRLHRAADRIGVGEQVAATVRAITGKRRLLPVVAGAALGMVLLQMLIEFGPLWLVGVRCGGGRVRALHRGDHGDPRCRWVARRAGAVLRPTSSRGGCGDRLGGEFPSCRK